MDNMKSQLENVEAGSVSNAVQLVYNKYEKAFVGMVKGPGSKILYDIQLQNKNGALYATFREVGGSKELVMVLEPLANGGEISKSGGKVPHYRGEHGSSSMGLWKSDYGPTTCFIIFNDVDPQQVAEADDFWNSTDDDERVEQAATFFKSADGVDGRPDQSRDSLEEQLKHSLALNG